jgi:Domain of unknown function (DUF5615)
MLRLVTDENFRGPILDGMRLRHPELDIVRVQDVDLAGADDPTILAWAAAENRVLLTHDRKTMQRYVEDRISGGLPMPGVCIVSDKMPVGQAIEQLLFVVFCGLEDEWKDQILQLPL